MATLTLVELVLGVLTTHWICDFVLQSETMSKNKSTSNKWLLVHVFIYSIFTTMFWAAISLTTGIGLVPPLMLAKLFVLIFVPHFVTDYITSRITKRLYEKKDYHNFFVAIGFDQLIHYICLLYTFNYVVL